MNLSRNVSEIIREHVTLEVESIDRMYLNVYQPQLQRDLGLVGFFRHHRGQAFASSVLMATMTRTFVSSIESFAKAQKIPVNGYGMMLAEIGLPPGADVDRASLETAMKSSDWAISQYDVLPDRVMVYLWPRAGGVKFDFHFRPRFELNAKTAPSLIYDYYNPEAQAVLAPARFKIR